MRKPLFAALPGLGTVLFAAFLTLGGCATVPRESVDLSYAVGQDLEALHQSYDTLIMRYFDALRGQVNDALDQVFVPTYINGFVESGKLMQHAQDQRADLVEAWARIAVKRIDRERRERLQPLDDAQRELLSSVDDAFQKAEHANAVITAELSSVVKVEGAQDEMLASMKLQGLHEKIESALVNASTKAEKITNDIKSADAKLSHVRQHER